MGDSRERQRLVVVALVQVATQIVARKEAEVSLSLIVGSERSLHIVLVVVVRRLMFNRCDLLVL